MTDARLVEALDWALSVVDVKDGGLRRGRYPGGYAKGYIDQKEKALAALAAAQPARSAGEGVEALAWSKRRTPDDPFPVPTVAELDEVLRRSLPHGVAFAIRPTGDPFTGWARSMLEPALAAPPGLMHPERPASVPPPAPDREARLVEALEAVASAAATMVALEHPDWSECSDPDCWVVPTERALAALAAARDTGAPADGGS